MFPSLKIDLVIGILDSLMTNLVSTGQYFVARVVHEPSQTAQLDLSSNSDRAGSAQAQSLN
ncbi:hypothetical protein Hanom_Chr16g01452691 [Helianthus anomalus]